MKRRVGPDQAASGAVSLKKISWDEKRKQPRVSVSWKASVESAVGTAKVQVKDVSHGGAFVVCNRPLPLNSRLVITLFPADQEPLDLNAEVVWSNVNVPADKVINRGMGIRFIENDEAVRNRLNRLIVGCFDEDF
jgi:Tfp pilus assembly protein PilZ